MQRGAFWKGSSDDRFRTKHEEKVEELSGQNVFECYQCGMCSAGCPLAEEMDLLPNQVLHALQMKDEAAMTAR